MQINREAMLFDVEVMSSDESPIHRVTGLQFKRDAHCALYPLNSASRTTSLVVAAIKIATRKPIVT